MIKTIKDYDLYNKRVIIRVDFNVPMKDGKITDDTRIVNSLETIRYAVKNGAKVILMSHLGRIKEECDKEKNTLKPVSIHLTKLLGYEVKFINETRGSMLENTIEAMEPSDVILMENTRFEDLDGKKESGNDPELAKYWASLGDIFINDAFGTCHRAHASNVGIASILPNGVGFLIKEEIDAFRKLNNPKRPYTVILGGAKVEDKIGVINNMVQKADYILIGGGMAYTFLNAQGKMIGKSILSSDNIEYAKEMLNKYPDKIFIPLDSVVSKEIGGYAKVKDIDNFDKDDIGLDIGPKTIEQYKEIINKSKTVVWNGPMGCFEYDKYAGGTIDLLECLENVETSIIGGGDTASAAVNLGYSDIITHISTGGGASLELLEGKSLPGLAIIEKK